MTKRQWYGIAIFALSILLWFTRSDTLKLVLREREVLFNRYSEGHFSVLVIVTLLLWVVVACLWSKRPLDRSLLADALTGIFMTVITILASVYLTHSMTKARYVEIDLGNEEQTEDNSGIAVTKSQNGNQNAAENTTTKKPAAPINKTPKSLPDTGLVRHRPPNTVDKFVVEDKPLHPRSYPNPPKGYADVKGTLTTDSKGFRNPGKLRDQYDIVIAGDSFAAGSHVSDEQVWTLLLEQKLGKSIYNLGASGTAPITYLNNYQRFGTQLKPSMTIFAIYEGNDFKADGIPKNLLEKNSILTAEQQTATTTPSVSTSAPIKAQQQTSPQQQAVAPAEAKKSASRDKKSSGFAQKWNAFTDHIEKAFKASPITRGLKVVSQRYFETAFADNELRKYGRVKDVMPMKVEQNGKTHYYAFDPKRLAYLYYTEDEFRQSKEWQATAKIIDAMADTAKANNSKPVFLYIPSTPHVVMPFAGNLPATPLARFLGYVEKDLPKSNELIKRQIFDRLDSEENVFMAYCIEKQLQCLSLTPAMQQALQQGIQTYYSYDQHWTPEGNEVAADAVARYLQDIKM